MERRAESPFQIAPAAGRDGAGGRPITETDPTAAPADRIEAMVQSSDVFLLIKGTPQRPQCGFSANTVAVMDSVGVSYRTFDVLSDEAVRSAAKRYAGWPTFPQVYIRGEFIGGNDIVTEMHSSGELQRLISGGGA